MPRLWPYRMESLSTYSIPRCDDARITSRGGSAKWTWTPRKFRGVLGGKDEGRAAKQRRLGKGRRRQPRQEWNAPLYRLQVHQSPCKLKARWGLGFTGHIWHHIRRRWGHHPDRGCSVGMLIPPTSASRQGPHYPRQQKEEPLCAISAVLYILNSATFSTQVHFN